MKLTSRGQKHSLSLQSIFSFPFEVQIEPTIYKIYNCFDLFLPPATKLGQGNIFRSMCPHSVHGGHVWLLRGGGMCGLLWGGMRGCSGGVCGCSGGGACMVAPGGVCMVSLGGMHGCSGGRCMVAPWGGGACMGYDEIRRYGQ